MPHPNRRQFLQYTGAVAGSGLTGIAAADNDGDAASKGGAIEKGPVGWKALRRLNDLPRLTGDAGVTARKFSSFDRSGGNDDGFSGTDSYFRRTDDGRYVLAEWTGAGEICSMWFVQAFDLLDVGDITIELDGETVLDAPLQEVVDSEVGAPFVFPLVANKNQSSGGGYVKVPMPFREEMRVVTDANPNFYHVTFRTFADAEGIETFDPSDPARDVIELLDDAGTRDPKPAAERATTHTASFALEPGETATLDERHGPGSISSLQVRIPQIVGPEASDPITDDGRAFGSNGASEFTVAVDPTNDRVRLTRRLAGGINNQRADVVVDGDAVAEWQPLADTGDEWVDQTVELPASTTSDASSLRVRNEFVSSNLDFNEFTYWVESRVDGEWVQTDVVDVGGNSAESEDAHDYRIENQTWQGVRTKRYPPEYDEDVIESKALLRDVRVRLSFDGRRTVDAPLGEFFGSGLVEAPVQSLFFAMDDSEGGWYSSWWPMPYRSSATVELYNGSEVPIDAGDARVTAARDSRWAAALGRNGEAGYFHATANRGPTEPDSDWLFLDETGRGKVVGVSHTMKGDEPLPRQTYLEGDQRVYVDGSRYPQLHGTGTEDFYEGGFYFARGPFSAPLNGAPVNRPQPTPLGEHGYTSAYRLLVGDAVPFSSGIRFGVEHGPANDIAGQYGSTTYWYGKRRPTRERSDALDVGNPASESAHSYEGPQGSAVADLTSTYVGDFEDVPVSDTGRHVDGEVSFRLDVNPRNRGVTLRRRSDHERPFQSAQVFVTPLGADDASEVNAGTWTQPVGNQTHRWHEGEFELSADLTAGAEALRVRLVPLDSAPNWHAAEYEACSRVPEFADRETPSAVTGLTATGESGAITLSWDPASDDVVVDRYDVYAAREPDFDLTDATRVGQTYASGFTHDGLGLDEKWYYRVRAIDGSGNEGVASGRAFGTTDDTLRIEGESLLPPEAATAPAFEQGNMSRFNGEWSEDAHLFFKADEAGDRLTCRFSVPEAGTYAVSGAFTKSWNYGRHELSFDGATTGTTFDGYSPSVERSNPVSYGEIEFDEGSHSVTLTATGKNDESSGFMAGIDYLELEIVE